MYPVQRAQRAEIHTEKLVVQVMELTQAGKEVKSEGINVNSDRSQKNQIQHTRCVQLQ